MSDSHLQLNPDGTVSDRRTVLWPLSKNLQEPIIRKIFEHNNWKVEEIKNQSGSFWKIVTSYKKITSKNVDNATDNEENTSDNKKTYNINLYISSIRDEDRNSREFKMQLGTTYPEHEESGWITLILGIYTIDDGENPKYLLSSYDESKYNFSTNPSLRGTQTPDLQEAYFLGMYKNDNCIIFRPEFIYYFIENKDSLLGKVPPKKSQPSTDTIKASTQTISYLTALRTKPFMLLAGISGTGKSRIVRKLAQACVTEELQRMYDPKSVAKGFNCWELHKPANFEIIQVKPNWHNSLEVVGYKSNIGTPHYEFTPFVEFVARAWQHQEVPFFLCLDEMNLAPVEQYFAEFLSAIESRSIENDKYETDPIIKPFSEFDTKDDSGNVTDKLSDRMIAHLVGKLDSQEKSDLAERFRTKGLTLPKNLFILGTVNMDETTFSFSRKVLDRAMSIVMNDVDYDAFFDGRTEYDMAEMNSETKDLLINRDIKGLNAENNHANEVEKYLNDINTTLKDTPFMLGYRAANEALLYVSAAFKLNPATKLNDALDEFTLMKILSRIEGDKRSIGSLLSDLQKVITTDYPKSNEKLQKMDATLQTKQFVSYWT